MIILFEYAWKSGDEFNVLSDLLIKNIIFCYILIWICNEREAESEKMFHLAEILWVSCESGLIWRRSTNT